MIMLNRSIKFLSILFAIVVLCACGSQKNEEWLLSERSNLENLVDKKDIIVFSETTLETRLNNLVNARNDLSTIDYEALSADSKVIYKKVQNEVNRELYLQDTVDVYHWNAAIYRFSPLMEKQLSSAKNENEAFEAANELLNLTDSFYTVAKANISKAISINMGKLAVKEHRADYLFLQNEFSGTLANSSISDDLKKEIGEKVQNLQLQIKDYIGYVTSQINNMDDLDNKVLIVDEGDDLKKYAK
jgi:hypothetical protein